MIKMAKAMGVDDPTSGQDFIKALDDLIASIGCADLKMSAEGITEEELNLYPTKVHEVLGGDITADPLPLSDADYLPRASDWKIGRQLSTEMFATGFSMAMMQCVFSLGSVVLQRSINALDTDIITAHTASRRVYEMLMFPMSTVSGVTGPFVGQNYGAKRYPRIREANRKMLLVELIWSVFSILVCWTLGRPLVILLTATENEEIIANALLNLRLSTACFFPLGALFILRYSMQAMGHKVLPVLSSTITCV